jgi:hypothetical protein
MARSGAGAATGWVGSRSCRGRVAAASGLQLQCCIEYKLGVEFSILRESRHRDDLCLNTPGSLAGPRHVGWAASRC